MREAATICPALCKLTFDCLTVKVVSESRVTWVRPPSVPFLVFLGLCSRLRPDVRDRRRQTDARRQTASSFNAPPSGRGHYNTTELSMSDFRREMDISTSKWWLALDFLLIFISISCLFDQTTEFRADTMATYRVMKILLLMLVTLWPSKIFDILTFETRYLQVSRDIPHATRELW